MTMKVDERIRREYPTPEALDRRVIKLEEEVKQLKADLEHARKVGWTNHGD